MNKGFQTIGNAILICYDQSPILTTDPWIKGSAYFGSWVLSHEIPEEQMEAILDSEYIWLSHGHPDHLHSTSIDILNNKKILLPNHYGGRIYYELKEKGYNVNILEDGMWVNLSNNIKIMCISDYNQDAILLIDINGILLVNINDASDRAWGGYVRKITKEYEISFLLSLSGYGDADMINYFNNDGDRILPNGGEKKPFGKSIVKLTEKIGAKFFIPFSSMHKYQRTDSIWVNKWTTDISDYSKGFKSDKCEILPAYISYDCISDMFEKINPKEVKIMPVEPIEFGDAWDEPLENSDLNKIKEYFGKISHLRKVLSFINFKIANKDNFIDINPNLSDKGITFEVPRNSLMKAIDFEIFDDLLIGNFMKTTIHGSWSNTKKLYPEFTPYVSKYADNAQVKSKIELSNYFKEYQKRALLNFVRNPFEINSKKAIRLFLPPDSIVYRSGDIAFRAAKKIQRMIQ